MQVTEGRSGMSAVTPITMVWIVAIPLLDTVVTMARRMRWRGSPFNPDREHLHHLLIRSGLTVEIAVWIIHLIAVLLATIGVSLWWLQVKEVYSFVGFLGVACSYFLFVKYLARQAIQFGY